MFNVTWSLDVLLTFEKRSTEGCSKLKSPETRQVQENIGLNIRAFAKRMIKISSFFACLDYVVRITTLVRILSASVPPCRDILWTTTWKGMEKTRHTSSKYILNAHNRSVVSVNYLKDSCHAYSKQQTSLPWLYATLNELQVSGESIISWEFR